MDPRKEEELYRMTRENNQMLHSMRRSAFWGGVIKFTFYILVLVVAPLWFYNVYLQPIVGQFSNANTSAQTGMSNFAEFFKQFSSQ